MALDIVFGNKSVRQSFTRWSGHGLVPLVLSVAVTFIGHSELVIKSAALILCAIWISLDIGAELAGKSKWPAYKKAIIFCTTFFAFSCAAMGTMWWFLNVALEAQQEDVFNKLDITVPRPETGNPITTMFSVKNNAATNIGTHHISCKDDFILFEGPNVFADGRSSFDKYFVPLSGGGDGDTVPCLESLPATFKNLGPILCADIRIVVDYSLESQPQVPRQKPARFITRKEGDHFVWYVQPIKESASPCRDVLQRQVTYPLSKLPF
jgi:hypothetical protein